jgi:hypothetical protein
VPFICSGQLLGFQLNIYSIDPFYAAMQNASPSHKFAKKRTHVLPPLLEGDGEGIGASPLNFKDLKINIIKDMNTLSNFIRT